MMTHRTVRMVRAGLFLALVAVLAATTGCSGCVGTAEPVRTNVPKAEQDLCSIAQAYREAFEQSGKAPASFDDLRKHLSVFGNPDDMRISPNDSQPYVVMWGADPTRGGAGPVKGMWALIAHEQTGKDGKRAVADMRGLATTVTDEEFAKMTFIRKRKSDKSGGKSSG